MNLATIDCGTTNSRVYIVNEDAEILGKAAKKVGVRDTAIHGSNEVLKDGLKEIFYQALKNAKLQLEDIKFVISSGMITSEIGLLEIPHLWAPTGMDDLASNIRKIHDTSIFPVDIPIYFIRGIKNRYDPKSTAIKDVGFLDFMRGEEAQIAGLLSTDRVQPPFTVVVLSSHTKFIPVSENGKILGSLTTVSGQVYEAIIKETFIGKSIKKNTDFDNSSYFDEHVVDSAYTWVSRSGFLRTMLMPRFLDTLLKTTWYERKLFVEAAIAAEDMRAVNQFDMLHFPLDTNFILVGDQSRCILYEYLLREKIQIKKDILTIEKTEDVDRLSIKGAIYLAKTAGLL
jgi:2-dehydro-3-deoxygalactonokinase